MTDELLFLRNQGIEEHFIQGILDFRKEHSIDESLKDRIQKPMIPFYGSNILKMAIASLLQGENILLAGSKATGKNILAENLAYLFGRPSYNISFHVNTDSNSLIGTDTFEQNQVILRKGPVYQCAVSGGFGIFDEINMAKNDAVSVLHATLDYRRIIDIPGYHKISLHPATRFIGTMNYGYAGTKELNEALVSRFLVIHMPELTLETLLQILSSFFPNANQEALEQFSGLFLDLQLKAMNGEISTKPMDLRGMIAAIKTIQAGLSPFLAIQMGITNKSFDLFERNIIEDLVLTRIPETWTSNHVFHN